jgi:hypothetical protein
MAAPTATHPDYQAEQAYISRAYDLLDRGLADSERSFQELDPPHRATAQAMRRALEILRNSRGSGQLVFGRTDMNGERMYIGRRRVHDENKDLVVVGWHAPAARVYYEASPQDPRDLDLKRVFVEEDRRLLAIMDEIVSSSAVAVAGAEPAPAPPGISDALLRELERSRDGAMREVVATIQAEQFRIIRADRDCIMVVQGGPGTGKSVVGLHRAAWLAFNDDDLRCRGILVVAPNTAFLSYISGVLPSLDASDVHQADLASLYPGEAGVTGTDDPQTARVKGSAQMATVLARALRARTGWHGADLEFSLGMDRVRVAGSDVLALLADVQDRSLSHGEARDVLRQALSALAFRRYQEHQREVGRPVVANESTIRRLSAFTNALDRHLGSSALRVENLTIGYRVPAQVLDLASRQLPLIGPGLLPPQSVRSGRDDPTAAHSAPGTVLTHAILLARDAVSASMTTAVIVADSMYEELCRLCDSSGVAAGDGRDGDFALELTLVPVSLAKGLEFDCVVVAEPAAIVAAGTVGRRQLYIAMTRCTQELRLVHSRPLPAGLEQLAPPPAMQAPTAGGDIARPEPASPTDDMAALISLLGPGDRLLVETLVRRLVGRGAGDQPAAGRG